MLGGLDPNGLYATTFTVCAPLGTGRLTFRHLQEGSTGGGVISITRLSSTRMRYPVGETAGASHSSLTVRVGRHATIVAGNTSAARNRAAELEMIISPAV